VIRRTLANPHADQAICAQMLALAAQNLHQPDVLASLVEVLPEVRDTGTRRGLLSLLMETDSSRFPSPEALYSALIGALAIEQERATRAALLRRLAGGVDQDERLAPLLVESLARGGLSDEEAVAVNEAVSRLVSVSEDVAATALQRARHASTAVQELALSIAECCPHWGDRIVEELRPYLEPRVDRRLRLRVLHRLAEARALTAAYLPILSGILRTDPDQRTRAAALEVLPRLVSWDEGATLQLLWTAENDADPSLRARAIHLQASAPELSDEQVALLAGRLAGDDMAAVRVQVLGMLPGRLGDAAVRAALAASYEQSPSAFGTRELTLLLALLAPHARRDPALAEMLLRSLPRVRQLTDRELVLQSILPHLRADVAVETLVAAFRTERAPALRGVLLAHLRPLSVVGHPGLVTAYCSELADPGSPFRTECASALSGAITTHPEVVTAFEDVLRHDDDRELVRTCLDAYLEPAVPRRFDVLLAVASNQAVDLEARQRSLDSIDRGALSAQEAERLSDLLAGPGGTGLRART
jgi:hypothetical protein